MSFTPWPIAIRDDSGVTRLEGEAVGQPSGAGVLKTVRVPIAFNTPGLFVPGAGIVVYTPAVNETLLPWSRVTITTVFDGTPASVLSVYPQGILPSDYLCAGTLDGLGPDGPGTGLWRGPALVFADSDNGTVPADSGLVALTPTPIMAVVDNGAGLDPNPTQGSGEIVLVILAAP